MLHCVPDLESQRSRCTVVILAIVLLGVLGAPPSAQAQFKRADDTGYLKFGGGLSHYVGDRSTGDALSYAWVGEVGYQFAPSFGLGLAYQAGRYPQTGTPDTDRFTTQLLARYTFGARSWTVAPYLDAGASLSFTGSNSGGGPSAGVGLDFVLNDYASFYIESRTNLVFGDAVADNVDAGTSYDALSQIVGAGFKLTFRAAPTPPTVQSVDGPTEVHTGESVTYTARINDDASRPLEYRWAFGDGASGSGLTDSHTFEEPGTYTVRFTAENRAGQDSRSLSVQAERPPQPASITSINASPNPADTGEQVQFSSNAQGDSPISYEWSFGDGSSASGSDPSHTYQEPGSYTVRLEASNDAGSDSRTLTMRVNRALPEMCTTISELNSSFFEYNSSTLTDEAEEQLTENVDVLSKCSNLDVRIEGFAAPGERNAQSLSEDRAEAVADYYRANGIEGARITTSGEGVVEGITTKKGGTEQYRRVDTVPLQADEMGEAGAGQGNDVLDTSPEQSEKTRAGGPWRIVVASMRSRDGAETMARRYGRRLLLPVQIVTADLEQGRRHRVVVGTFRSSSAAKEALQTHRSSLPDGAWTLALR